MSIPLVPRRFVDTTNLDVDDVNDNLTTMARDVQRSLDKRYTYASFNFDLSGMTDADALVLRQFALRRMGASAGLEIIGVELSLYVADAGTWTVSCSDTSFPSFTAVGAGDNTVEVTGSNGVPVSVASSSSDLVFTLACSGASTVTNGTLTVHTRCDRGNQGTSHAGYAPTLLDSTSSTAGATLDTELTAFEAAVSRDGTNNLDVRIECFVGRALVAGTARGAWRLPGGARRKAFAIGYVAGQVAGGSNNVVFTIDSQTLTVLGTGATARNVGTLVLTGSTGADPSDATGDTSVSMVATTVDALLAYLLVFWT